MLKLIKELSVCAFCLLLLCTACRRTERVNSGGREETETQFSKSENQDIAPGAGEAVERCEDFFNAYTKLDGETAGALLTGLGEPLSFGQLSAAMAESLTAELGDAVVDGETVRVNAVITSIDIAGVLEAVPQTVSSQEEAAEALEELLRAPDAPFKVFQVEVLMVLQDGAWRLKMTPELSDALLGGSQSLVDRIIEEGE